MTHSPAQPPPPPGELPLPTVADSPFLRAPEGARTIFLVTVFAACGPLVGGMVIFGWRAAIVAALAIATCVVVERLYYRVTRTPALLGRSHSVLTGALLALTLPAFVPWYVPVAAGAFAIIVGKAIFGGVGHFVWQPALVGRLAVAVLFAAQVSVADSRFSSLQPVLAQETLLWGDVRNAAVGDATKPWRGRAAPQGRDAFLLPRPVEVLRGLTSRESPKYSALVFRPADRPGAKPAALLQMPSMDNLLYGARPGGIGEPGVILIAVAGLYLIYRNYIKWHLPVGFAAAAWLTAAVAPIYLEGPNDTVRTLWLPLLTPEGMGVACTYVHYQLLAGELPLAALIISCEMTSRPVTTGGQVMFGTACGALAMLAQLYLNVSIPAYMAVLAVTTLTPAIDRFWRPRVFGTRHFAVLRGQ